MDYEVLRKLEALRLNLIQTKFFLIQIFCVRSGPKWFYLNLKLTSFAYHVYSNDKDDWKDE